MAKKLTQTLSSPTIPIPAPVHSHPQVFLIHHILPIFPAKTPNFLKNFIHPKHTLQPPVQPYLHQVKAKTFPPSQHSFPSYPQLKNLLSKFSDNLFLNSPHLSPFQPTKPHQHHNQTKITHTPNPHPHTQKIIPYPPITQPPHHPFQPLKQPPLLQPQPPPTTTPTSSTPPHPFQPQLITPPPYPLHPT
ncbi:3-methyl-2-oxobutanoate hydroxymethyltransferase, partial [Neisseria sicca]|uniref:3-methyl-2-oxobutanoate hydroxymethyltransferase n=1 Tax=Neisseria sicca TaxID=490 RepID=UPI0034D978C3